MDCQFCRIGNQFVPAVVDHEGTPLCQPCADHDNENMRPIRAAYALCKALGTYRGAKAA